MYGFLFLVGVSLTGLPLLAQSSPPPIVEQPQQVRPLPGKVDPVLMFNSNSPEVVQTEGILLSTFPSAGMKVPTAHLNLRLQGRFDLFAHHIARANPPEDLRTLYLGIILHNPSQQTVTVNILQAASYLSQPDAPFIELPPVSENDLGTVFAGPGDRITNDVLRRERQPGWPAQIVIPPGQSQMLMNLPIPVKTLTPPINGRSTLIRVQTNGPVYAASLGMFARTDLEGNERPPTLEEWSTLLQTAGLSGPRDKAPTPPNAPGKLVYGRVAGVAQGSRWQAQLSDAGRSGLKLTIPVRGAAFSYMLSSLPGGTFGTGEVQSAPLLVRYPDTAYQAHGNYGLEYDLSLPLYNPTKQSQTIALTLQTPLKSDQPATSLRFYNPPPRRVFFRGTIRLRYRSDGGTPQTRYIHLVQQQGQQGEALLTLTLAPGELRLVQVQLLYPPDATPPQVLTVKTLTEPEL
uniref:DUF3370 domain-containing protein n=1 Tax=Cyanothece sp. (strain PCC 7425 / ATCC 29141) TaxID=395961 RepID=B8HVU3_CYAP4